MLPLRAKHSKSRVPAATATTSSHNYHAKRGSAAMDGAAGSEIVVSGAAGAAPDAVMDQAPGLAAPDAAAKPPRAKRAAADAMSPGHLAATAALSSADKRVQHAVMGVDKEFRDKVKDASDSL